MAAGVAVREADPPARERPTSARHAGATSSVAWMPAKDIDVHEWIHAGKRLGAMTRCSQWWLGDWIRYGTRRWGEKYREVSQITGYDIQSLRNFAYVAGRVEAYRRRDGLTWSHHAEVGSLQPADQERWLDLAESEKMSVSDLRTELRAARRNDSKGDPGGSPASSGTDDAATGTVVCPECQHEFEVADP